MEIGPKNKRKKSNKQTNKHIYMHICILIWETGRLFYNMLIYFGI